MSRLIPSLNWLRVFEVAARVENFARAAELLNMSTSAVSQQIKALESHLDTSLFSRGAKSVELTDAGHAFIPAVRQSLKTIEESANSLFGKEKEHTLTLQCELLFATSWLGPRIRKFSESVPNVQLHVSGNYHDLDYQRPGSELHILFGPVHRSWAQCERLFDDQITPVASESIADSIQSSEDLRKYRLLQTSTHQINWNQILENLQIEDFPVNQFSFTDSTLIALSMAASGQGIALARSPTTDNLVEKLKLKPVFPESAIHSNEAYYLVYRNLESLSTAALQFREWLHRQIVIH